MHTNRRSLIFLTLVILSIFLCACNPQAIVEAVRDQQGTVEYPAELGLMSGTKVTWMPDDEQLLFEDPNGGASRVVYSGFTTFFGLSPITLTWDTKDDQIVIHQSSGEIVMVWNYDTLRQFLYDETMIPANRLSISFEPDEITTQGDNGTKYLVELGEHTLCVTNISRLSQQCRIPYIWSDQLRWLPTVEVQLPEKG